MSRHFARPQFCSSIRIRGETPITIFDDTDRQLPLINSNFSNLFEKLNAMVALDCDARVHIELPVIVRRFTHLGVVSPKNRHRDMESCFGKSLNNTVALVDIVIFVLKKKKKKKKKHHALVELCCATTCFVVMTTDWKINVYCPVITCRVPQGFASAMSDMIFNSIIDLFADGHHVEVITPSALVN